MLTSLPHKLMGNDAVIIRKCEWSERSSVYRKIWVFFRKNFQTLVEKQKVVKLWLSYSGDVCYSHVTYHSHVTLQTLMLSELWWLHFEKTEVKVDFSSIES